MSTLEVKFYSHRIGVAHFDGLVPVAGNTFKCFRFGPEQGRLRRGLFSFLTLIDVMSQKFCFFFQTAFVGLLRLISKGRSLEVQLVFRLYVFGTSLLLYEVLRMTYLWEDALISLSLELGQANMSKCAGLRLLHGLGRELIEIGIEVAVACRKVTIDARTQILPLLTL
jgi:hypothetical protein